MVKYNSSNFGRHDLWNVSMQSGIKPNIHELATMAARQLRANLETKWDPSNLTTILNALMAHYIPIDVILQYNLGRLVKMVRNRATRNLNKSVADSSKQVMDKWRRLLTEGYPTAKKQQQSTASLRLNIEKDAPTTATRPKTAGNKIAFELSNASSFFSRTTSTRSLFTVPQQQHQQQHADMDTLLDHLQQNNTASIKKTTSKRLSTTATTKLSKSRSTQRVRFKPDHQLASAQKRHVEKVPNKQPLVRYDSWYPPHRIQIPDSCRRPWQDKMNSNTAATTDKIVTPTLTIPSKSDVSNNNTKIIPLFEIDTVTESFISGVVKPSSSYIR
ncbi:hypothetical protein BCR42DRAFT_401286 [Absidia repens]|uniref:TFIIS N-terminal domain-containing protein n=1 Tax=Absidia repens TaxID=90262 RepID=A0A1X2J299_9FUNG|nr:hypothetical protein BCR42DRAFT_401286 [Absidia repens]